MKGLDTDILVRFYAQDDPEQCRRGDEFLQTLTPESPGYVSVVSLIELIWVLRSQYRLKKTELIKILEQLLDSPELMVENHTAVTLALRRFSQVRADFADCLIERSGAAAGCGETVTFDVDASRFAGMRLL
ncbi:MAG: type II toxin-antitoxin system VapC family toxin [Terracidiphilus sp.]|jgi:predicted nucleic-acid-binding protein